MRRNVTAGEYCENCNNHLDENDRYCRECGAKRGAKPYVPEDMDIQCVYGPPPMTRTHKCDSCDFTWEVSAMIDNERYCPKCGSKALIIDEKDPWKD